MSSDQPHRFSDAGPGVSGAGTVAEPEPVALPARRRGRVGHLFRLLLVGAVLYLVVAYVLLPLGWHRHETHHPALADAPELTTTVSGIPGDPLNVGLVGSEEDVHLALLAAKWYPADPITLKSAMRIAAGVVFDRPYQDAPVSSLYLWGRKEDLAFEQPVGSDPRRRHHVRFWRSTKLDAAGRPLWMGAATFDTRVGLSHTTGEITHHIAPDVDAERDKVIDDLRQAGKLSAVRWTDGFHKALSGRNGGGDPWRTDGRLAIGVLEVQQAPGTNRQTGAMGAGQPGTPSRGANG